jgi:membrane protease subunit HflK
MSLNDPQWGRGSGGEGKDDGRPVEDKDKDARPERDPRSQGNRPQRPGQDGPPDLEELWRDFNKRLNGLFGKQGSGGSGRGNGGNGGRGGGLRPDAKGAGIGAAAVLGAAALIWLGSGFYIVDEGRVGVVTTFGR